MQEITKQKPVLCLESSTFLLGEALDCILEAYSKDEYCEVKKNCRENTVQIATRLPTQWRNGTFISLGVLTATQRSLYGDGYGW